MIALLESGLTENRRSFNNRKLSLQTPIASSAPKLMSKSPEPGSFAPTNPFNFLLESPHKNSTKQLVFTNEKADLKRKLAS